MDKVFSVYAAAEDSIRERCTTLSLPTMPYELMDVLSKINVFDKFMISRRSIWSLLRARRAIGRNACLN